MRLFILGPRQIGSCWNSETFCPENEWALWIRLCPRWNVQRDIWWESPKQRWDIGGRNMLTRSQSSWTATLLATQSRGRARRDWWLRSVTTPWILDRRFRAESQVGLSLRSMCQDLGIPMKIEIQSDSSTANSLTDRLGARQRAKHIDTRYFWIQERVQDGNLSLKKVPTAKNCTDVGTKPVPASLLQQHCKFAGDPTLHCKMMVTSLWWIWWRGCRPDVNTETYAQKQKVVSVDREHRDGCASCVKPMNGGQVWALLTMKGSWKQLQEAKLGQGATQWQDAARNFEHWLTPNFARTFRANQCAMMTVGERERESRHFFKTKLCLYIELFRPESFVRTDEFFLWFLWILPLLLTSLAFKVQYAWEEDC